MTLKPMANKFFPLLLGSGLTRRGTRPSTDRGRPPLTIGSMPSKEPFYGTAHHHSWPEDVYAHGVGGDGGGVHGMTDLEQKEPRITNGTATADDMRIQDAGLEGKVRLPDEAHAKPGPPTHPRGRDADTFYASSSDMTATDMASKSPV